MRDQGLTHLDETGAARMVDVSGKAHTQRMARAEGRVLMTPQTREAILAGNAAKGDVLGAARIAGIMAAKKTGDLIPLCHPLALSSVEVDIAADDRDGHTGLCVTATARLTGQTGVEMEAMTAVSIACLTIYDMAKALDKSMTITGVRLLEKTGGKSGHWTRDDAP